MIKIVYGLKGSGKTLYAVSYIKKYHKQYSSVYTNIGVDLSIGDNVFFLNTEPVYYMQGKKTVCEFPFDNHSFDRNSLLVFDESALRFNNRAWDSFSKSVLDLLCNERRYEYDVMFLVQNPQMIDVNILRLADEHILCNNNFKWYDCFLRLFGFLKREHYDTSLCLQSIADWDTDGSQVVVGLSYTCSKYLFKRRYYKYYNTYKIDNRDPYEKSRDFSSGV